MKKYNYVLETTVFICGSVVMIFEIVGSRILGPFFGTSIFVWTSIIGIILGSLSLGYYLGGRISDKKASLKGLSLIILLSAIAIIFTILIKDIFLSFLQTGIQNIKLNSVISSLILFSPTSILLGMVSPYSIKLKMSNLEKSGSVVGNLYAISTIGSILGTFLAGFFLIPIIGSIKLLILLSLVLIILSLFISRNRKVLKIILSVLILTIFFISNSFSSLERKSGLINIDTEYNHITILDYINKNTEKKARYLKINNEIHSAMFLESNELVFDYSKYYHLVKHFNPNFEKILMIGGGAYSFPKDYLRKYKDAKIDVVEIDPKITEIAEKYFNLEKDERLKVYHEDGRTFLNKNEEKYDAILIDAFLSYYSIPFQLTTREVIEKEFNSLNDGGLVIVNIISSINGKNGEFLRAEFGTYKSVFPQVYLFPVVGKDAGEIQNIILVAIKSENIPSFESDNYEFNEMLSHLWREEIAFSKLILTDDFAPVDYYIGKFLK